MKAILVIDVPTLDDGRHLCNECPIWNNEHFFCQYGFNMEAKGCPLKPMPDRMEHDDASVYKQGFANGFNTCVEILEIYGDNK